MSDKEVLKEKEREKEVTEEKDARMNNKEVPKENE